MSTPILARLLRKLSARALNNGILIGQTNPQAARYLGGIRERFYDPIRLATLFTLAHNIESANVPGHAAELGVYCGEFASAINAAFPDRKLYLFDTFEGFDRKQIAGDIKNFNAKDRDFSDTSVELVMGRMGRPGNCVVKKGLFPATAHDVDERFAFVSLDADLYEPTLAGLEFFHPRLERGGYIMVHDCDAIPSGTTFPGCRKAVETFCRNHGVTFIPVADKHHSALITK